MKSVATTSSTRTIALLDLALVGRCGGRRMCRRPLSSLALQELFFPSRSSTTVLGASRTEGRRAIAATSGGGGTAAGSSGASSTTMEIGRRRWLHHRQQNRNRREVHTSGSGDKNAGGGGSSTTSSRISAKADTEKARSGFGRGAFLASCTAAALTVGAASYETRRWRDRKISELPSVCDDVDIWSIVPASSSFAAASNDTNAANTVKLRRTLSAIIPTVQRAGLMGKSVSVRTELDDIRRWHHQNGYLGGLVLRDLAKPLFGSASSGGADGGGADTTAANTNAKVKDMNSKDSSKTNDTKLSRESVKPDNEDSTSSWTLVEDMMADPVRYARRECYFLYYEIKGDGQIVQQIFCRGTTLTVDVLTCLEIWMVHDEELGCRVHRGFRNQADRILDDVLPLLAAAGNPRATVEVCGHSLGGAVATILAAKLRIRGYKVVQLTTVGEPRFCATKADALHLRKRHLPPDSLRIENELDVVTFLPPFAKHVSDKLWLVRSDAAAAAATSDDDATPDRTEPGTVAKFVPVTSRWSDSALVNFLGWEILASKGKQHLVPNYVGALTKAHDSKPRSPAN